MRNLLDAAPKANRVSLHARGSVLFEAPDPKTARTLLQQVVEEFGSTAPMAVAVLEEGWEDATAVLALPQGIRRRLRTTNGVERLNQEIRRRERVIRIFPNRDSAVRLAGAVLMQIDESVVHGPPLPGHGRALPVAREQAISRYEPVSGATRDLSSTPWFRRVRESVRAPTRVVARRNRCTSV